MDYLITILLMAVTTALINNMVFHYFVGNCPFIGVSRRVDAAFGMGAAVTAVTTVSGLLSWVVTYYILAPNKLPNGTVVSAPLTGLVVKLFNPGYKDAVDLTILSYAVYIFLIAWAVQLVEMYIRKFFPPLYKAFGVYLPLITTNCVILFTCLEIMRHAYRTSGAEYWSLDKTLIYSFFAGFGFLIAIVIMAGIREELDKADIPKALRGPGITMVLAGILSMAFMGFAGVDKGLQKALTKPVAAATMQDSWSGASRQTAPATTSAPATATASAPATRAAGQ
ncbi:MAG: hypothetical protein LLG01_01885 [Planctomycetaceae bacterium]|nr:hypothetical protein [Planctomycetaceae bacterium]